MFEAVGVLPEEEAVYSLLVRHSPAAPNDLANRCGFSPRRTSKALNGLVQKGLANRLPGRSARYVAAAPDIAVEALVQDHEEQLRATRLAARRMMREFHDSHIPDAARIIEVITGVENVSAAFHQIQRIAKAEVRALSRPPYAVDPTVPNVIEHTKLTQSVRYRAVWDKDALAIPGLLEHIHEDLRRGEETRVFTGVPIKLVLADDRCGLVPLSRTGSSSQSAIIVHPSELLDALAALFELVWRDARPLRTAPNDAANTDGDQPTAVQRTLLELLANGLTDDAIGRTLGWSLRTVQRHVRQLMDTLGADIRFQAGIAAAKRGWL